MNKEHKYEVAFSFLAQDEAIAQRLNDLLQNRMSTFIYSERQKEVAGTDGEIVFKKVFVTESRIVVILYRNEWGTTPWTRIEQDAIRERGHDHGYDFCLLIPLDMQATKPEWFPPHRLWIGLCRWGVEAAAAVIDARVQEVGGLTREESLIDRKERLERQVLAREKRKAFLESAQAVQPAVREADYTLTEIERLAKTLTSKEFALNTKKENNGLIVSSGWFILHTFWELRYTNSLKESGLYLRLRKLDVNKGWDSKGREIKCYDYSFCLDESEQHGWKTLSSKTEFTTSTKLAEFAIGLLVDAVADDRERNAKL